MKTRGVFLSHSSPDKPFARFLARDLQRYGVRVWIDEAEIKVGESLIDKISEGIEETEHLLVVLSAASVDSGWVRREVNVALTREINGRRVQVLPCLLSDCKVPSFLLDKKYADFRTPDRYYAARSELFAALGIEELDELHEFLDRHVYFDLNNLNYGFDVTPIRYFGLDEFERVLDRIEIFDGEVLGIEAWPDGEFGGARTYEEYGKRANDPSWYRQALKELVEEDVTSHFSGSFRIPDRVVAAFSRRASVA
jgi:hypothetical protein